MAAPTVFRKFLMRKAPPERLSKIETIQQHYFAYLSEGEGEDEITLHRFVKIKGDVEDGSVLQIGSIEHRLTAAATQQLMGRCPKPLIWTRYGFSWNLYRFEVDEYEHLDVCTALFGFETEQQARLFRIPEWIAGDISQDREYERYRLWVRLQTNNVLPLARFAEPYVRVSDRSALMKKVYAVHSGT